MVRYFNFNFMLFLEFEICQQDIRIDLKCQFTQKKINIPVKGQWCEHDMCFDLENYTGMN